jgi:hypothetical protein
VRLHASPAIWAISTDLWHENVFFAKRDDFIGRFHTVDFDFISEFSTEIIADQSAIDTFILFKANPVKFI